MNSLEQWDDLIAGIYDAALDPGAWPLVVERATEAVGAHDAMLFIADWSQRDVSVFVRHRVDPEVVERWMTDFLDHDLWTAALPAKEAGSVATGASIVDPADLRRSIFYNELLGPSGMCDLLSTVLTKERAVRAVLSFHRRDLFQQRELTVLRRLVPHLQRAVRLQAGLMAAGARAAAAEAGLDRLSLGVVTLDGRGRILTANRKAEAILRAEDGLSMRAGKLCGAGAQATKEIEAAVERAGRAAAGGSADGASTLAVARPSLRRPFGVTVTPVRHRTAPHAPVVSADVLGRAAVLLMISDPEDAAPPPAERLVVLFGLTPAEARLAAALAGRQSLEEFADQARITIGTARWTLKRVLEKTGTRRQSELVHLVATSVAGVLAEERNE